MASRSLLRTKSNGLEINSETFCHMKISRGNAFMRVVNFFLTTNAVLLDKLEVQLMKKWLPDDIAAPSQRGEGLFALFSYNPLIETTSTENALEMNTEENNDSERLQHV